MFDNATIGLTYVPKGQSDHGGGFNAPPSDGCEWQSILFAHPCLANTKVYWTLTHDPVNPVWNITLWGIADSGQVLGAWLTFNNGPSDNTFQCLGTNSWSGPFWHGNGCSSSSGVTITPG